MFQDMMNPHDDDDFEDDYEVEDDDYCHPEDHCSSRSTPSYYSDGEPIQTGFIRKIIYSDGEVDYYEEYDDPRDCAID
jgi:hypothetical protein